jgi:hypothetical protein
MEVQETVQNYLIHGADEIVYCEGRKVAILTHNITYLYCTAIQIFTAKTIIVFT